MLKQTGIILYLNFAYWKLLFKTSTIALLLNGEVNPVEIVQLMFKMVGGGGGNKQQLQENKMKETKKLHEHM